MNTSSSRTPIPTTGRNTTPSSIDGRGNYTGSALKHDTCVDDASRQPYNTSHYRQYRHASNCTTTGGSKPEQASRLRSETNRVGRNTREYSSSPFLGGLCQLGILYRGIHE